MLCVTLWLQWMPSQSNQLSKKIPFKGITQAPLDEMSFKELKALASSKGFKGNYKKAELIELLSNA